MWSQNYIRQKGQVVRGTDSLKPTAEMQRGNWHWALKQNVYYLVLSSLGLPLHHGRVKHETCLHSCGRQWQETGLKVLRVPAIFFRPPRAQDGQVLIHLCILTANTEVAPGRSAWELGPRSWDGSRSPQPVCHCALHSTEADSPKLCFPWGCCQPLPQARPLGGATGWKWGSRQCPGSETRKRGSRGQMAVSVPKPGWWQ